MSDPDLPQSVKVFFLFIFHVNIIVCGPYQRIHVIVTQFAIISLFTVLTSIIWIAVWPYGICVVMQQPGGQTGSQGKKCAGDNNNPTRPARSVKRKLCSESRNNSACTSTSSKNKESNNGGDEPPGKEGRKQAYHDGEACGDCAVWLSLGGDPLLRSKHVTDKWVQHPEENSDVFSKYLSVNSQQFSLPPDRCMCNGCYADCKRNAGKQNKQSRWVELHLKSKN